MNCLAGLDEADEGSVAIDGQDLAQLSDAERSDHRAATMGFVFQSGGLLPVFTAVENVELALLLTGVSRREARTRAVAALDRVGLGHRHDHRPAELSGGEQQRVAIARAMVADPLVVWADEPTGNLDSGSARQVMDLLLEMQRDGLTLVMVTHDADIAAAADHRVEMQDGLVVGSILVP